MVGVHWLFLSQHTKYFYPLLDALEGHEFLSKRLNQAGIQMAFKSGAQYHIETWTQQFYDHIFIPPRTYADGLILSGHDNAHNPIFEQLLVEADQGDLQELQKRTDYAGQSVDFRAAIEEALCTAEPGETRFNRPYWRVKIAKETFEEIAGLGIIKVIADIISSYAVYRHYFGKRAGTAKRIIDEITGASTATEEIGYIVSSFVGTDEVSERNE